MAVGRDSHHVGGKTDQDKRPQGFVGPQHTPGRGPGYAGEETCQAAPWVRARAGLRVDTPPAGARQAQGLGQQDTPLLSDAG